MHDLVPLTMHLAVALHLLSYFYSYKLEYFSCWPPNNLDVQVSLIIFGVNFTFLRLRAAVTRPLVLPQQPLAFRRDRKGQVEGYCASVDLRFALYRNTFNQYHCDAPNSAFPGVRVSLYVLRVLLPSSGQSPWRCPHPPPPLFSTKSNRSSHLYAKKVPWRTCPPCPRGAWKGDKGGIQPGGFLTPRQPFAWRGPVGTSLGFGGESAPWHPRDGTCWVLGG